MPCIRSASCGDVVVREHQHIVRRLRHIDDRLQERLRFVRLFRSNVEDRQRPVCQRILRIDAQRSAKLPFRVFRAAGAPIEIGKCQTCGHRLGIGLSGLLEGSFCEIVVSFCQLNSAEAGIAGAAAGVQGYGGLHLRDRRVKVAEAGHGVPLGNQRIHVLGVDRQRLVGTGGRVGKLPRQHEDVRGFQLCVDIIGQQVGGANIFTVGAVHVVETFVRFGELESGLAKSRILLDRVAVFDHRLLVFLLGGIFVAAAHVFALSHFRIF